MKYDNIVLVNIDLEIACCSRFSARNWKRYHGHSAGANLNVHALRFKCALLYTAIATYCQVANGRGPGDSMSALFY